MQPVVDVVLLAYQFILSNNNKIVTIMIIMVAIMIVMMTIIIKIIDVNTTITKTHKQ